MPGTKLLYTFLNSDKTVDFQAAVCTPSKRPGAQYVGKPVSRGSEGAAKTVEVGVGRLSSEMHHIGPTAASFKYKS